MIVVRESETNKGELLVRLLIVIRPWYEHVNGGNWAAPLAAIRLEDRDTSALISSPVLNIGCGTSLLCCRSLTGGRREPWRDNWQANQQGKQTGHRARVFVSTVPDGAKNQRRILCS